MTKLICVFVFAYAKSWFSRDGAQITLTHLDIFKIAKFVVFFYKQTVISVENF